MFKPFRDLLIIHFRLSFCIPSPLFQQFRHTGFKRPIGNVDAHLLHQPNQRAQVVDGEQRTSEQFLGHDQVTDVGAREGFAGVAVAGVVNGTGVAGEVCVHHVEAAFGRERGMVTREAGGEDAIEDVHAAGDAVDQVFGSPDAHQVARLVFGQEGSHHVEHVVHFGFRLADGETAEGDAGRPEGSDILR